MKRIYVEGGHGMTRVALLENNNLMEYYIERDGEAQGRMTGSVYVGKVQNILPGMQAAFIDIGTERNAFLYMGDAGEGAFPGEDVSAAAKKGKPCLRVGQKIAVQVVKEPEGQKGARVTTHITIPGRLGVLITDMDYIGVSRRIEDEAERDRLRAAIASFKPDGTGFILRTAAEGLSAQELAPEFDALYAQWDAIRKKIRDAQPPRCVHRDDTLLRRTIRDLFSDCVDAFVVSDQALYDCAAEQVHALSPSLLPRLKLYDGEDALFDASGIEAKAEKALSRKVWLKNGGYLIIDHTEALTVIDVNTGKFTGDRNLQDTVFRMNIEAVGEIARQLRLRDVGGIIIVDFIDMEDEQRRAELIEALRNALKRDRNKTNLVGLTGLGLVEMTRKKTRASLPCVAQRPCPDCGGSGRVLKCDLVARRALRTIERSRASGAQARMRLCASPDVIEAFRALRDTPPDIETCASDCCRAEEFTVDTLIANRVQD